MMKKPLAVLAWTVGVALASGPAHAQSSEIKVTGKISPSACQLALGNGGVFDYGGIARESLLENVQEMLERKEQTLTVTCVTPTKFALRARDNFPNSVNLIGSDPRPTRFGLSSNSANKPGYYEIALVYPVGDGKAINVLEQESVGGTWLSGYKFYLDADGASSISFAAPGLPEPQAYRTVSATLHVLPRIAGWSTLDFSNGPVELNGSATLELTYL